MPVCLPADRLASPECGGTLHVLCLPAHPTTWLGAPTQSLTCCPALIYAVTKALPFRRHYVDWVGQQQCRQLSRVKWLKLGPVGTCGNSCGLVRLCISLLQPRHDGLEQMIKSENVSHHENIMCVLQQAAGVPFSAQHQRLLCNVLATPQTTSARAQGREVMCGSTPRWLCHLN